MNKRLIVLSFLLVMLFSINVLAEETGVLEDKIQVELNDVSENDWFYSDVTYLIQKGIVNGYSDNTFRPSDNIQVDAFIKMLVTALGYQIENGTEYWASTYIDKAIELEVISEGDFTIYNRPVTRGEMAMLAANTLAMLEEDAAYLHYKHQITDFEAIDASQQSSVMIAMSKGIITGYEDFSFKANELATRAQAATIITRIIDRDKRKYQDFYQTLENDFEGYSKHLSTLEESLIPYINTSITQLLGEDIGYSGNEDAELALEQLLSHFDVLLNDLGEQLSLAEGDKESQVAILDGLEWRATYDENMVSIMNFDESGHYTSIHLASSYNQLYIFDKDSSDAYTFNIQKNVGSSYDYAISLTQKDTNERKETVLLYRNWSSTKNIHYNFYQNYELYAGVEYHDDYTLRHDKSISTDETSWKNGFVTMKHSPNNDKNGYIQMQFSNGDRLIGEMKNELLNGGGKFVIKNEGTYIGEFPGTGFTGEGVAFLNNDVVIQDTFINYIPLSIDSYVFNSNLEDGSLDKRIDTIISETITNSMTDNEKIRAIHDYLVRNITYADEVIEEEVLTAPTINNPYSAIIERRTVCFGYSEAMNLILNRLGIESYIVLGDANKDGINDHAWNYIKFEEGFYHTDVTWDDPDSGSKILTEYFKVSESKILKERNISDILGFEE